MPTKETLYICDVCGAKYKSSHTAKECEKAHYVPVQLTSQKYDEGDRNMEYPAFINVRLINGKGDERVVTYTRGNPRAIDKKEEAKRKQNFFEAYS